MVKVIVYNFNTGEKKDEVELDPKLFEVSFNPDLVHQVAVSQYANQRPKIAHTKDRGEVRGGGKKPWRQKGTGRARHGSIRSPIWKGGGVVFGPKVERNFKKSIPIKMRRKALFSLLSKKISDSEFFLFDKIKIQTPKTKELSEKLGSLSEKIGISRKQSANMVLSEKDKDIFLAAKNLNKINTILAKDLNPLALLNFKYIFIDIPGVEKIKETFKV